MVSLRDVWKKYGEVEAVKGVSFDCEEGMFFCLLGPSGAGKTSILKMIAGVENVTSGEIYINEVCVNDVKPQERDVAMMFENYALYPQLTVFENIASPLRSSKRRNQYSFAEIERIVRRIAQMLSIEQLLDRYPRQLSGGQKQRVALGRALVRRPSVFLLDEPISHLDAKLRHNMRTELKKIHEEIGVSFIYATPDQLEAISMADKVVVINKGEVQQIGTPLEIFNHPANEFVAGFTGEPPMNIFECFLERKEGKLFLLTEHFSLPISDEIRNQLEKKLNEREVKGGIRPTDIHISSSSNDGSCIPAEIYVVEPLGRYTIVTAKINDLFFKIKIKGYFKAREGEKINLKFDVSRLHFFDKATGKAIVS